MEIGTADETVAETWLVDEVATAYDALKADPSRAIPAEHVRRHFEAKWRRRAEQNRAALGAASEKLDERLQLSEAEVEAAVVDLDRLRHSKP